MLMESPYEKIELFWPLNLLQNSVEIIDSPGLNEHATRTQVATDYLTKADAVLFVFTATALCSADEMKFIENTLRQKGFEDIYFIVNRFDALGEKDKIRTKEYAKVKLADQTSFGEKGIFFVSALNALEGKENNDMARYNSSGLPEFEKSLADFLVHQKGKMKLLQPARELKRILNEEALFKILPQQQRMLDSSLDDLKKRYEQAKPKLDQLVIKKNQMRERINLLIEQMFPEIRRYINNYFMDLNNSIPVWIKDYEPTNSISIFSVKKGANLLIGELSDFVKDQIEEEQGVWLNETLQPLISDKIKNMMTTIEGSLENFFVELDAIKINITGANTSPVNDIPLWQRVAAAGGGLLIGDIGVATLGGVTGFSKDFAKGIAIQLGAYMGLALFGLLNPVTILLVIGAAVINAILSTGNAMEKKVKDKFVEATLKQINDSSSESVEKMVEDIKIKIAELGTMVVNSMDSEINEVQVQVTDIIANMEKGQAQINIRKAELNTCEEQIKTFSTDLDNFIFQLIEK